MCSQKHSTEKSNKLLLSNFMLIKKIYFQSSPLLAPTAAGVASVQIPGKGWIIFGGEGGTLPGSQLLRNISKINIRFIFLKL